MTAFQSDWQTLWRPEIRDGPEWKRLMCNSWILQTATRGFLSFTFYCPQLIIPSLSHLLFIHVHVPASFPVHGWVPPSPARLSLSSVDETTEGSETAFESRAGDEHQWMVRWKHWRMVLGFMWHHCRNIHPVKPILSVTELRLAGLYLHFFTV